MIIVFWLPFVGILAFAATWMALVAMAVGYLLYLMQIEALAQRSFVLVRRYGLWGALRWRRLRALIGRTAISKSAQPRHRNVIVMFIFVSFVSGAAAAMLPLLVGTFIPHRSVEFSNILDRTAILDGVLGAITGSALWIQGLSYVARPSIHRRWGNLPQLSLPSELGRSARDHFALSIFWHNRLKVAACFASIYPLLWLAFLPVSPSSVNSTDPHRSSISLIAELLVVIFFAALLVPALIVTEAIGRRMVTAQLYRKLYDLLWHHEADETERQVPLTLPTDPLGSQRIELAEIADYLSAVARRLDAHQPRGFAPHPIATLLRGSHHSIQQFLRNKNSLNESMPNSLRQTLTMVVAVLLGPRDLAVYHQLDVRIAAFDQHGDPAVELTSKPPTRLAVAADRITRSIQRVSAVTVGMATIVALLLAVILAILGKFSLSALVGHLR